MSVAGADLALVTPPLSPFAHSWAWLVAKTQCFPPLDERLPSPLERVGLPAVAQATAEAHIRQRTSEPLPKPRLRTSLRLRVAADNHGFRPSRQELRGRLRTLRAPPPVGPATRRLRLREKFGSRLEKLRTSYRMRSAGQCRHPAAAQAAARTPHGIHGGRTEDMRHVREVLPSSAPLLKRFGLCASERSGRASASLR